MDNYEKGVAEEEEGGEGTAVERAFEWQRVPPLREQLTARALAVSFLLSVMFSVIVMKLNLTTGIIPSLNVAAGLLGFFFVKLWTRALEHAGLRTPFTRQENTVIQASVTAAYGLAFSGGFGNYLFGMSSMIAKQATEANDSQNTKDPNLGWMIGFLFVVSFLGLFSLVPLRKIMIIDYKLIYPSGTATAYLINSFHTTQGEKLAGEQVGTLCKSFAGSFLWGFFQWFYTAGKDCGFIAFPTFGLKAYENKFYFDFSATYVGVGMICPHIVNLSLLLGAILSWGIMWPLINNQNGHWYPADTPPESLKGLQGYRVFIAVALILGDGLYNFLKVRRRGGEAVSVERAFEGQRVPPWREQLTARALAVSFLLSVMFSVIVMKLNLTTGIIPLNVAAGLLGFFFVKLWTKALEHVGLLRTPFTRQENTVIQTAVVAAYGLAFSGGFGSYLFGMSSKIADQTTEANDSRNIKDPKLGWMIGFMFVVSFLGLFSLVPLRKIMIIDYKLIYPSGTATAYLINGFHTPRGADVGQVLRLQLPVGFFQWFYTAGDDCGFEAFPTFGLKAYANRFYFDFSATYVGVGMICPYIVNVSLLLGAILSWGLMSLINNQKGHWYSADIPSSSLHSLQGYRVFLAVALILGDGLYNILRVLHRTICSFVSAARSGPTSSLPISDGGRAVTSPAASFDVKRRNEVFVKDQIPKWVAYVGYVAMAIVSIVTIPHLFPPLKWYHILVAYVFAPLLAFCNAYGCGLTDWNLASTYGKLAIFVFGAWAGAHHGGVLAGLAACGVMMTIVATASDLMQDFKTGYLTLASPRSMFVSQVIGTAMGCVIAPCVFWLFYKAFDDIGKPGTQYPAPYALIYRNIAILGVDGFSSLPKHCLTLLHILRARHCHQLGKRYVPKEGSEVYTDPDGHGYTVLHRHILRHRHVLGKRDTVCVERINKAKADAFGPAVASGLICGDGIWSLPQECLRWLEATNMHEVSVEENE
ncbi:OPT oligopeptide transporter protein [Musa troglodytarum]|uniref:OPT oligopeptide transporter protein n=1 Tax=Musa troglodytarum TaxID=320322 RepID=A0A9E7EWH5_9LILI|nr:OPT oligopeptide transporter protein [Musa troglodytarum]